MKKSIAILIVGQIRTNSLGNGNNNGFVDTFKSNFLNNQTIEKYNIDIFIAVDKIKTEKAFAYFGSHLKKIIQLDHENIKNPLDLDFYIEKYMEYYNYRKNNPQLFPIVTNPRPNCIHVFYKLYCAYILMKEYEENNNIKYDYIMKIRPDMSYHKNLLEDISYLEQHNLELMCHSEYGFFGKYDIMSHICQLIFVYGKYNYKEKKHENWITFNILYHDHYLNLDSQWPCWSESPEVQLIEHIIEYCYCNQISFDLLHNKFNNMNLFGDRFDKVE